MIFLMPYVAIFFSYNSILSVVEVISDTDKVELVSDLIRNVTTSFLGLKGIERQYVMIHRASSDFLKFLIIGVGSCGEMAYATKTFLDNFNIESRLVSFPGDDHMFVEVKIDDDWFVVDPGYGLNLVTREERGIIRLDNLGGLSYVVAYTDLGLVELTQYYVPTDKIEIRVMNNGEPMANVKIILKHTFMGSKRSLPEFSTDVNGTIELNLGPLTYNNSIIDPVDPYFLIYVNDKNTEIRVYSSGSGMFSYFEIDLSA